MKLIKRLVAGEISDLLTQNFVIYVTSYALTVLLSSLPSLGLFAPPDAGEMSSMQTLSDCLFPTTITLTISALIQNLSYNKKPHATLLWSPFITLIYGILYVRWRKSFYPWLPYVSCAVALLTAVINLWVVTQIQKECNPNRINGA